MTEVQCQNFKYCGGIINDKGKCNICPKGIGEISTSVFCDDPQCECPYRCLYCNFDSIAIYDNWSDANLKRIEKINLLEFENFNRYICTDCCKISDLCKNFIKCRNRSDNDNQLCDSCANKIIKKYKETHDSDDDFENS